MKKLIPNLMVKNIGKTIEFYLHTTFYGTQEFAIQDPNGYILVFAQSGQ